MPPSNIPVLLLKTKSAPHDSYEEYFSTPTSPFTPIFVPVLEHRPDAQNLDKVKGWLRDGELGRRYGGMIFTSQRAVEAFAGAVNEVGSLGLGMNAQPENHLTTFPIYTVGPATSRALSTLLSSPQAQTQIQTQSSPLPILIPQVFGAHTGNGGALAGYISDHYPTLFPKSKSLVGNIAAPLPLLFLTGVQRRDIIPLTLSARGIQVDEVEVYKTTTRASFGDDLASQLNRMQVQGKSNGEGSRANVVVIVVFSPQGTAELVENVKGSLFPFTSAKSEDEKTEDKEDRDILTSSVSSPSDPSTAQTQYILATIGPTTRDHLIKKHGIRPSVCAATPSPEGVARGVEEFLRAKEML